MRITRNIMPISDLYQWLEQRTLVINQQYQRGSGLWPASARSYFIDTILNDFPFPKVTIRQIIDTTSVGAKREVVDGQQRLTTIQDFINGKFKLSAVSKNFAGKKYSELGEDIQEKFLAYEISMDTITVGTNEEVLEIFRRMNSYTLPLNDPEKRHATYQGRFKWFILELLDNYSPFLEQSGVLTIKEIGRMKDADLMAELCQIVLVGVVDRSMPALNSLYKNNDTPAEFPMETECSNIVHTTLDYIKNEMYELFKNDKIPAYLFYSIFSALVYNKYGVKGIIQNDQMPYPVINRFCDDIQQAIQIILDMLRDVNEKNDQGRYGEFVRACSSSTQRVANRKIRLKWLVAALQAKI